MIQDTQQTHAELKIASIKRDHGKAILTLSNGEIRSMPRALLKERPYKSGMCFDEAAFSQLIKERSYAFAMDKAVTLLSMRSRTEKEIVDALRKNTYPEETIARVMQRLHEAGYINDSEYAAQYSSSRISRGLGSMRIRMELRKKGVDSEAIDHAIETIDSDDLLESAIRVARKASHSRNLMDRADRQKILAALARRGYDYQTAKHALDAVINEQ